jgi:hypothetical protein
VLVLERVRLTHANLNPEGYSERFINKRKMIEKSVNEKIVFCFDTIGAFMKYNSQEPYNPFADIFFCLNLVSMDFTFGNTRVANANFCNNLLKDCTTHITNNERPV